MHSNKTLRMDISSISIWTETRNDGDTLKIRKKGVN